jgi:ADP-ribosyl-[dinitrogen reductase] hydrolase
MSSAVGDRARFQGALLGLAAGDAVGATVEFKAPGTFARVTDLVGGGPFALPAGAWTDDTSMALCLAESLVERGGFDPVDQLERYVRWYREGYWSSTGRCFDIGGATRAALHQFERSHEPYPGDRDRQAAGNGPLMKLAPIALAYATHPSEAIRCAGLSARTTHGAPEAIDACRYWALLLVGALRGASRDELLGVGGGLGAVLPDPWGDEPLHPKIAAIAAGSFREKSPPAIRGSGYIVDALEAALWAVSSTDDFEAAVLAAVNLGDDADTTAAIAGQLAGAIYGVDAIPKRWRDQIVMRDEILALADALRAGAASFDPSGEPLTPRKPAETPRPRIHQRAPHAPAPTPTGVDAYWAVPGRLLAGEYPGARDRHEAAAKLDALLDTGVTCFVDLTEEGEGPPLHPYGALLRARAVARGTHVTVLRFSVPDVGIPAPWQMRAILSAIGLALDADEIAYVHCWGGVGRTGTVIGCRLVEDGVPASEVLSRIAELRSATARAGRISPETSDQRSFVTSWLARR